jgi:hypothetical protein
MTKRDFEQELIHDYYYDMVKRLTTWVTTDGNV